MARVTPEASLAHLSVDAVFTAVQKNAIDPMLIGAFDETLRLAQQPEREGGGDAAMVSQETRSTDELGGVSETREQDSRERDDRPSEEVDRSVASDRETSSPEDVEAGTTQNEREAESDENTEQGTSEEDVTVSEEASEETDGDGEAVVVPVFEEPTVQETEEGVSSEGQGEKISSGKENGEATDPQVSGSQVTETAVKQAGVEAGADEAAIVTEGTQETVDVTGDNPGEEAESETEQKPPEGDSGKVVRTDEKADVDAADLSEELKAASDSTETSQEVPQDEESQHTGDRRTDGSRGDKREVVSARAHGPQGASTHVGPSVPTDGGAGATQVQDASVASDTVAALPNAGAADAGPTTSAPQTSGTSEAVTGVESRSANAQSRVNAGEGTGKGAAQGVDSAKFVQRVANAFSALGQRSGPVRLKLYPPELGSLRMEITVKNGTLSAKVEAETAAARSMLVDNLPVLRERLAEQGIKVDRFDVGVSDQSEGGPSERPDDGDRSSRETGRETGAQSSARETDGESPEGHHEQRPHIDGRLDVFI